MFVFTFETEVLRLRNGRKYREAKQIKIELPERVEEITLRSWADFTELRERAPEFFTDATVDAVEGKDRTKAIPAGAWQDFIAHALESVWTLAANRDEFSRDDLTGLPIAAHAEAEAFDGLLAMFAMVMKPIREYEPKKRDSFQHRGNTYALYTDYLDQFGQDWVGRDMRTSEAVDALQFEQIFFSKDEDGNYYVKDGRYKNDLALVAMLSRKKLPNGELELPPISLSDRTEWLDNRMVELAGVGMDVALDVGFFLPDSSSALQTTLLSVLRGKTRHRQQV